MKKTLLALTFLSGFSVASSVVAKEEFQVVVDFDSAASPYSEGSKRQEIASSLIANLNTSISNSSLGQYATFKLKYVTRGPIGKGHETSINEYHQLYANRNTLNDKLPKERLHHVQKNFSADFVIAVVDTPDDDKSGGLCGRAFGVPTKSWIENGGDVDTLLASADFGIVFVHYRDECIADEVTVSHEIGHSMGLSHGKAVADCENDDTHYMGSILLETYASGHAECDWWASNDFSTIMGRHSVDGYRVSHNFFSDPNKSICGESNLTCGDSVEANAVKYLKDYVNRIGKRSEWYK